MRVKCLVQYDGSQFAGYQVQHNERTVQAEIERVLSTMHKGQFIRIHGSGRTDSGVHAEGQVFHFDSDLTLPPVAWQKALNAQLPSDIAIIAVEHVADDFHARFSAVGKEYHYRVYTGAVRSVFNRTYAYHYPYPLDVEAMRNAAAELIGTHDFTSFCSAKTEVVDKVRTIYAIEISETDDELVFHFHGNGFLYNMVRILVGTLLDVGRGKFAANEMKKIIANANRDAAGRTAPSHGLYLHKVFYNN